MPTRHIESSSTIRTHAEYAASLPPALLTLLAESKDVPQLLAVRSIRRYNSESSLSSERGMGKLTGNTLGFLCITRLTIATVPAGESRNDMETERSSRTSFRRVGYAMLGGRSVKKNVERIAPSILLML